MTRQDEINESQGQGGISTIKFATVEDVKEPPKRLVVRKIDISGTKQSVPVQGSSGQCDEKIREAHAFSIEPWNDQCKKEPGNDPI